MFIPSFRSSRFVSLRTAACRTMLTLTVFCIAAFGARAAGALTLEEALRLAQEQSRQLTAQEAFANASRHMAVAAGQRPDPTLKAGINNLPVDGPDRFSLTRDFMTMRSIGVMQEFTREGKRKARAARFEREAEVAEASRELALTELQRDTAMAWLDRYYQERMRDAADRRSATRRSCRSRRPTPPIAAAAERRPTSSRRARRWR